MTFQALSKKILALAKKRGAKQAEVFIQRGRTSSVRVRNGDIEDLTEATSKGLGLRVFVKNRLGFAYTSDFDASGFSSFVDRAIMLAEASASNPLNGLPSKKEVGKWQEVPELFDEKVAALAPNWKIQAALEVERAGKATDKRVKTFNSVGAGESVSEVFLASSEGLSGGYDGTYVYLFAVPVAEESGQLQTSYWVDYKRFFDDLDSPESIGQEAARRAVRMLGARKVPSQRVPVIFDPLMTASFIETVAAATNGDAVYKNASFLASSLGKKVAAPGFSLVDDGRMPRGLASSPFDGEGVPSRRNALVDGGVLKTFLYDAFTARKAKTKSTGNASRSFRSLPSIGTHNLYLEPGAKTAQELIRDVKQGLYVTAMLGHGENIVTGDYSRGANGLWIENGELTYPVQEVTVAGQMQQMLSQIDGIANDLTFRGTTGAPTIRFSDLMVSGS